MSTVFENDPFFRPIVLVIPEPIVPLVVKPTIRRNRHGDEWVCSDDYVHAYGWGVTREAAYELWLSRFRRAVGRFA